jgi:RNA 2',3'-cyclic 3'-phosphodiesterase
VTGDGAASSCRASGDDLRLFVALDLPDRVKRDIGTWQRHVIEPRDELRVNRALHLTLCFLGATPSERVPGIRAALSGIAWTRLEMHIEPAVLFLPTRGAKRVVALSLDDAAGALDGLRSHVAEALARFVPGSPSDRPWRPHVTVARFRHPGQQISLQNVNIAPFGVDHVVLYSSLLERAGAVHTPVAVFPAS